MRSSTWLRSLLFALLPWAPCLADAGFQVLPPHPSCVAGMPLTLRAEQDGEPVAAHWTVLRDGRLLPRHDPREYLRHQDPEGTTQDFRFDRPGTQYVRVTPVGQREPGPIVRVTVLPDLPFADLAKGRPEVPDGLLDILEAPRPIVLARRVGEPFRLRWQPLPGALAQVLSYWQGPDVVRRDVTGQDHLDLSLDAWPGAMQVEAIAREGGRLVSRIQRFQVTLEGVTGFAGWPGKVGDQVGRASANRFRGLGGLAWRGGQVLVSDAGAHTLRLFSAEGEAKGTWGRSNEQGCQDGGPQEARFRKPTALATDSRGRVWIADAGNHAIRRLDPDGQVRTVAGDPQGRPGPVRDHDRWQDARIDTPAGLALDAEDRLYIADRGLGRVRLLGPNGEVSTLRQRTDLLAPDRPLALRGPSGLALDPVRGCLFVRDGRRLLAVRLDGPDLVRSVHVLAEDGGRLVFQDLDGMADVTPVDLDPGVDEDIPSGSLALAEGGLYLTAGGRLGAVRFLALGEGLAPLGLTTLAGGVEGPAVGLARDGGEALPGVALAALPWPRGLLLGGPGDPVLVACDSRVARLWQHPAALAAARAGVSGQVELAFQGLPEHLLLKPATVLDVRAHLSARNGQTPPGTWTLLLSGPEQTRGRATGANGQGLDASFRLKAAGTYQVAAQCLLEDGRYRHRQAEVAVFAKHRFNLRIDPRPTHMADEGQVEFTARNPDGGRVPARWTLVSGPGSMDTLEDGTGRYTPGQVLAKAIVHIRAQSRGGREVGEHKLLLLNKQLDLAMHDHLPKGWFEPAAGDPPSYERGPNQAARDQVRQGGGHGVAVWKPTRSKKDAGPKGTLTGSVGVNLPLVFRWQPEPAVKATLEVKTPLGSQTWDVTGKAETEVRLPGPPSESRLILLHLDRRGMTRKSVFNVDHQKLELYGAQVPYSRPGDEGMPLRQPWGIVWIGAQGWVADAEDHVIRRADRPGEILAGDVGQPARGPKDWPRLREPTFLASWARDWIFCSDTGNHVVRALWGRFGIKGGVRQGILAGSYGRQGFRDGPAMQALFNRPMGLAVAESRFHPTGSPERVFVADSGNHRIRVIENDTVRTLAGTGEAGFDDARGTFQDLRGLAYDQEERCLYVVDGHAIRRVGMDGKVETLVGVVGVAGQSDSLFLQDLRLPCLNRPCGVSILRGWHPAHPDPGNYNHLVIADTGNHALRVVSLRSRRDAQGGSLGPAEPVALTTYVGDPGSPQLRYGLIRHGAPGPLEPEQAALDAPRCFAPYWEGSLHGLLTSGRSVVKLRPVHDGVGPDLPEFTLADLEAMEAGETLTASVSLDAPRQAGPRQEVPVTVQLSLRGGGQGPWSQAHLGPPDRIILGVFTADGRSVLTRDIPFQQDGQGRAAQQVDENGEPWYGARLRPVHAGPLLLGPAGQFKETVAFPATGAYVVAATVLTRKGATVTGTARVVVASGNQDLKRPAGQPVLPLD